MKWIAVIFALLNVAVFFWAAKLAPNEIQTQRSSAYEVINPSEMTTVKSDDRLAKVPASMPASTQQANIDSQAAADNIEAKADSAYQSVLKAQLATNNASGVVIQTLEDEKLTRVDQNSQAMEASSAARSGVKAASSNTSDLTGTQDAETKSVEEAKPAAAAQQEKLAIIACFRVGPFTDQNSLAQTRWRLERHNVKYQLNSGPGEIKAVRVYMGAYASSSELNRDKARLTQMDIEHFLIRVNGEPLLQLGYFSEPARAAIYAQKLRKQDLKVKSEMIYRNANINAWLRLQNITREAVNSLNLSRALKIQEQACL